MYVQFRLKYIYLRADICIYPCSATLLLVMKWIQDVYVSAATQSFGTYLGWFAVSQSILYKKDYTKQLKNIILLA